MSDTEEKVQHLNKCLTESIDALKDIDMSKVSVGDIEWLGNIINYLQTDFIFRQRKEIQNLRKSINIKEEDENKSEDTRVFCVGYRNKWGTNRHREFVLTPKSTVNSYDYYVEKYKDVHEELLSDGWVFEIIYDVDDKHISNIIDKIRGKV